MNITLIARAQRSGGAKGGADGGREGSLRALATQICDLCFLLAFGTEKHSHTHKTVQTFYASFVVCFKKLNPLLLKAKAKAKAKAKEVAL